MSNLLAALRYAEQGWHVFPIYEIRFDGECSCDRDCSSPGKHPRPFNGLDDATTDETKIRKWWMEWPDSNVGIRTGPESGLLVLDMDPKNDGVKSFDALSKKLGGFPPTRRVHTGGDGLHLYFRYPSVRVGNSTGKLAPGIDIRGDRGYVVAPPSNHKSGNVYYEDADYEAICDFPEALVATLTRPEPKEPVNGHTPTPHLPGSTSVYGRAALDGETQVVARAAEGTRNGVLNKSAFRIGQLVSGGEVSIADAEVFIQAAAKAAGLSDREVRDVFNRGSSAGMDHPRSAQPKLPQDRAPVVEISPDLVYAWDLADIVGEADPPPVDEFVHQVFTRPSLNLVFGPPSAGKSWAIMALLLDAVALGGGDGFLGDGDLSINSTVDDVALWIFGSEDTEARVKRRLRTLWGKGEAPGRGKFITATLPPGVTLNTPQGWKWLEDLITKHKATVIALDTIASLTAGMLDVNKAEQVAPFMGKLLELRARLNLVIFLLHHTRKAGQDMKRGLISHADSMLGAQTWRSLADGCLMLDANDGDTGEVTVRLVKAKDIDRPIPFLRVTLVPGTGRFRPLEGEEEAPKREKSPGGRPSAFDVKSVLALRDAYPDGVQWSTIWQTLGGKESTFKNHRKKLQNDLLNLNHVVIEDRLRWGT